MWRRHGEREWPVFCGRIRSSSGANQALDGTDGLGQLVVPRRLVTAARGLHDAVTEVLVDEPDADNLERGRHRRELRQDVDAVAVVVDHPLEPTDLSFDAP